MIENAVSDFPLPDSPTSPRVSPADTAKLMSITAGRKRPSTSNPVVRCSTASSGPSDIDLRMLPEHRTPRIRDFADRRVGADRLYVCIDAEDVDSLGLAAGELVDSDDPAGTVVDGLLCAIRRLLDFALDESLLDRCERSAGRIDPLEKSGRCLLDLVGLLFDEVGASDGVDGVRHARLGRENLLRPQSDSRRFLRRQGEGLVAAVAM